MARRPSLVWGVSIALHGVLLGAVYEIVWRPRAAHPENEFARGDGSAEGGVVREWSIVAQTPSLPVSISAEVDHDPASDDRAGHDVTSDQSNEDAANFASADLPQLVDQDQKTPAVFGVASASQPTGVKLATKAPWGSNNQSNAGSSPAPSVSGSNQNQAKQNAGGNPVAQATGGSGPGIPAGAISRALPAPVYPEESRRRRDGGGGAGTIGMARQGVHDFSMILRTTG